ncbi:MAG: hypothetical protein E7439_00910 [Ruminococcaceae bacterium]|nr:hypothetical protein [Oscillospiraceae bacterium]
MNLRWIGVFLVVAGCGGVGFGMAWNYKREEGALRQILRVLDQMLCELEYRMTTLPELFRRGAEISTGSVRKLMDCMAVELEQQIAPDAACCMKVALQKTPELPSKAADALWELGSSLGVYDLPGQQMGIRAVRDRCCTLLQEMESQHTQRIRSYQTLGLCAGAALAILLI